MALATKATRGAVGTNNWTNPSNATSDNGVYATAAPGKNSSVIGDWDFAAFIDAEIPVGATINSVTIRANFKVSTTASVASLGIQAGNNGVFDAEETNTAEPTVDTDYDVVYNTAPNETDLKTAGRLVARIRGIRGNSNNAVTFSLDYAELRVDYSSAQTFPISLVATAIGTATLSRVATFPKTMAATGVGVAVLSKIATFPKTLVATAVGTATLSKVATFPKTMAATAVGVAVLSKVATFPKTLAATAIGVATLARKQFVTFSATAVGVAGLSLANLFTKTLSAVAVGVATITESFTFTITQAATAVGVATLTRATTFAKTLAATAVGVATLVAQFIAGAVKKKPPGASPFGRFPGRY